MRSLTRVGTVSSTTFQDSATYTQSSLQAENTSGRNSGGKSGELSIGVEARIVLISSLVSDRLDRRGYFKTFD